MQGRALRSRRAAGAGIGVYTITPSCSQGCYLAISMQGQDAPRWASSVKPHPHLGFPAASASCQQPLLSTARLPLPGSRSHPDGGAQAAVSLHKQRPHPIHSQQRASPASVCTARGAAPGEQC